MIFLLFTIASFGLYAANLKTVVAMDISPTVTQLNRAIISATEQDVENEEAEMGLNHNDPVKLLKFVLDSVRHLWQRFRVPRNEEFLNTEFKRLLQDIDEGRGKLRKRRKLLKYLHLFAVGLLIAKSFVFPLILKMLIAITSASFLMSKMAFITSLLLTLRWLLSAGVSGNQRANFEVIHLPTGINAVRPYNRGGEAPFKLDHFENWADNTERKKSKYRGRDHVRQYIPLGDINNHYTHKNYDSIAINEGQPFL